MGNLVFDERIDLTVLKAKQIWIRGGKVIAGKFGSPYPKKIRIELHGAHDSEALLIDEFIDAGNKVLAVTGGLELFG
jgi:hypothetical protein